jgi:choice-of-anchor C domain-containing protein
LRIHRSLCVAAATAAVFGAVGGAHAATAYDAGVPFGPPHARAVVAPPSFGAGSFEAPQAPQAPVGSFMTLSAGQSLGPWTVTEGSVDLIGARYWAASEGDQSLDLNGAEAGAVSQTFATTPGTLYTVSYSLGGNPDSAMPAVRTGTALVDGRDVQDFSFDVTGKTQLDMGYVTQQFTFLATRPASTLTLASTTNGAYGPVIDNIQIYKQQVPAFG